jgi:hypothetical protein
MFVTYLIISYVIGLAAFITDFIVARKGSKLEALTFRIVLLVLSPLVAWHAALHWIKFFYRKATLK